MSEKRLVSLDFEGNGVRYALDADGTPLWVAKDVCQVLGISKHRQAIERLKGNVTRPIKQDTLGGAQEMTAVTEPGLYQLIFRSNKPAAERFQDWVFSEVLPSIRKTGSYSINRKNWLDARQENKLARRVETDVIKSFIAYAEKQGSQSAHMYYTNFSKMVNSAILDYDTKNKPKNLRDHLNVIQLHSISLAETIIARSLVECMQRGLHYKEIYRLAKGRIEIYASAVGKTALGTSMRECVGLIA